MLKRTGEKVEQTEEEFQEKCRKKKSNSSSGKRS